MDARDPAGPGGRHHATRHQGKHSPTRRSTEAKQERIAVDKLARSAGEIPGLNASSLWRHVLPRRPMRRTYAAKRLISMTAGIVDSRACATPIFEYRPPDTVRSLTFAHWRRQAGVRRFTAALPPSSPPLFGTEHNRTYTECGRYVRDRVLSYEVPILSAIISRWAKISHRMC